VTRFYLSIALAVSVVIVNGCTRTPDAYRAGDSVATSAARESSAWLSLVGSVEIGVTERFVNRVTGEHTELTVTSEYFSANGRKCRRFVQIRAGDQSAVPGLGCQDSDGSWREVSLSVGVD